MVIVNFRPEVVSKVEALEAVAKARMGGAEEVASGKLTIVDRGQNVQVPVQFAKIAINDKTVVIEKFHGTRNAEVLFFRVRALDTKWNQSKAVTLRIDETR